MAHWVFVLGNHHRMILEIVHAATLLEADGILESHTGVNPARRPDVAAYCLEWSFGEASWNQDYMANLCAH